MKDKEIQKLIDIESRRQSDVLNLIASENYVSHDVREALGSILTNKYAEGYPDARYYGGNNVVDQIENLAKKRALKLFGLAPHKWGVNVQAYSGSPANLAVYLATVPLGGKIMGMQLDMGGHLTHGHHASVTGKLWKQVPYVVDKDSEELDYDAILELAHREKPYLIVAGYTAYSRRIDFRKFRSIADEAGMILVADISHIAGLVAAGEHPSPFPYADIVMMTTHKTLRGPRSAVIFSREKYSEAIQKAVFPGLQGGPHINQIAATAVALKEASSSQFQKYIRQVIKNARVLAEELSRKDWRIISYGTDTHLFLMDTQKNGISGKKASELLEEVGIIVNKNTIPFDPRSPVDPSGIRLGSAALTTRGMKESEMKLIATLIDECLRGKNIKGIQKNVKLLARNFPIPS